MVISTYGEHDVAVAELDEAIRRHDLWTGLKYAVASSRVIYTGGEFYDADDGIPTRVVSKDNRAVMVVVDMNMRTPISAEREAARMCDELLGQALQKRRNASLSAMGFDVSDDTRALGRAMARWLWLGGVITSKSGGVYVIVPDHDEDITVGKVGISRAKSRFYRTCVTPITSKEVYVPDNSAGGAWIAQGGIVSKNMADAYLLPPVVVVGSGCSNTAVVSLSKVMLGFFKDTANNQLMSDLSKFWADASPTNTMPTFSQIVAIIRTGPIIVESGSGPLIVDLFESNTLLDYSTVVADVFRAVAHAADFPGCPSEGQGMCFGTFPSA
jgi:hypothetical protein